MIQALLFFLESCILQSCFQVSSRSVRLDNGVIVEDTNHFASHSAYALDVVEHILAKRSFDWAVGILAKDCFKDMAFDLGALVLGKGWHVGVFFLVIQGDVNLLYHCSYSVDPFDPVRRIAPAPFDIQVEVGDRIVCWCSAS
jgi:hypothetical protein